MSRLKNLNCIDNNLIKMDSSLNMNANAESDVFDQKENDVKQVEQIENLRYHYNLKN